MRLAKNCGAEFFNLRRPLGVLTVSNREECNVMTMWDS